MAWGFVSGIVQISALGSVKFRQSDGVCYGLARPSLCGMSELFDAVPCGIQPVSEWIVSGTARGRVVDAVDAVLFLPVAA